jgi:Ca-activated chloride channel family protein
MRTSVNWGIWLVASLQLGCNGCSGANAGQAVVVAVPDGTQPAAHDGHVYRSISHPDPEPRSGAGHTFKPISHPPHTFASYRPLRESDLPRLVQRNCFAGEEDHTRYRPTPAFAPPPSRAPMPAAAERSMEGGGPSLKDIGTIGASGYGSAKRGSAVTNAPKPASRPGGSHSSAPTQKQAANAREELAAPAPDMAPKGRHDSNHEPSRYFDWGASLYLSNDDTMSLSSAQRVLFAIDNRLPIPPAHIRPHEFLNYFSFDTAAVSPTNDFSVLASIEEKPGTPGVYTLGLAVSGRDVTRETRRNAGLTLVIDRSGSMSADGRMDYLKQGLRRMTSELKQGDLVNLVLFDHNVCTPLENFVVGRDPMSLLESTISRIQPRGSTDLNAGLVQGYKLANAAYRDEFSNRVLLISDALANTGVTDPQLMGLVTESYDKRRIRLSGVGVGRDFNDELLDRLTEKGRGAYVFLGSSAEVDAVFGHRFVSLIETVANDVHFRLHLPPSLRMNTFYGEESSTVKSEVQAIHYFAGTDQLFLSDLMAKKGTLETRDDIMLTVEYEHPESGAKQVEEFAFNLGRIRGPAHNLGKGRLLMSFIDGVKDIELTHQNNRSQDPEYAARQCYNGQTSLRDQADQLRRDPEVDRVLSLWKDYCQRYPEAVRSVQLRHPEPQHGMQRQPPRGNDVWPNAR